MTRTEWIELARNLVSALVVAGFTAFLTVQLALSRFYTERWWERKATAYSELLAALHDIVRYGEEFLNAFRRGYHLLPEYQERLAERSREGSSRLAHEAAVGAFVVSRQAADIIERCRKQLFKDEPNDSIDEIMRRSTSAARECLAELRAEAKRDLRIKE